VNVGYQPTERAFQQTIIDAARVLGWLTYHTFDSRRSAAGFPDLILVRGNRMLAIEVKGPRGRVSEAQQAWLELLNDVPGVHALVAYPDDWESVECALRG